MNGTDNINDRYRTVLKSPDTYKADSSVDVAFSGVTVALAGNTESRRQAVVTFSTSLARQTAVSFGTVAFFYGGSTM